MKQRTFFDQELEADLRAKHGPTDPNVHQADVKRLTGQNARIYQRLKAGPATAAELSLISLKYTSRISDLRHHGCIIECERLADGTTRYWMK